MDAASAASWCRAAHTVGPGRVWEAEQRLGLADGADARPGHLLGRSGEVLHRTELAPGHREDVDGPEQRRRQEAVGASRSRTRPSGGTRRGRRTGCRPPRGPAGPTAPPPRRGGCGSAATTSVDDDGGRPDHHERHDGGGDLPSSGEAPSPRRVAPLGPVGRSALGSPGSPLFTAGSVLPVKSAIQPPLRRLFYASFSRGCHIVVFQRLPSLRGLPRGIVWPLSRSRRRHCDLWLCPLDRIPWNDDCGGLASSD